MSRSLKKGPYIHYKLEKKVLAAQEQNKKTTINTKIKASIKVDFTCAIDKSKESLVLYKIKCFTSFGKSLDAFSIIAFTAICTSLELDPGN